jgi:hypothetical protein
MIALCSPLLEEVMSHLQMATAKFSCLASNDHLHSWCCRFGFKSKHVALAVGLIKKKFDLIANHKKTL